MTFNLFDKMKIKYLGLIILLAIISCKPNNEKRTASGMRYILHAHKDRGRKPVKGDYVTVRMVYRDANDSVLFDSRVKPARFQLRQSPFAGSMEEGLMELSEGDSATLFVSADSMYEKVLGPVSDFTVAKPKAGSFLKFDVKLARVQNYNEAELEMATNEANMMDAEARTLESYMKEKEIAANAEPEGYFIIRHSEGKGELITPGTTVQINYAGRFLNGNLFDSNVDKGKPYTFTIGAGSVIAGWELAFQKLKQGDKATLIIPSKLAYGKEGLRNPNGSVYRVPPYSTLVFDVEVLQAKPAKNS
jgi:FKBP-type peptidyl-prolyl cis-trans isomerase FkpA